MSESTLFFSIIKIDSDIRQNDIMPLNTGNCIITLRKFLNFRKVLVIRDSDVIGSEVRYLTSSMLTTTCEILRYASE